MGPRISLSASERTVPWVINVNPARLTCGNELDSDGLCHHVAFIAKDVYVVPAGIDEPHPLGVHMGSAPAIVAFHRRSPFPP
jgi:hypothetical protein